MKIACRIIVVLFLIVTSAALAEDQPKPAPRGLPVQQKRIRVLPQEMAPVPIEVNFAEPLVQRSRSVVNYDYFSNGVVQHASCVVDEIDRQEKKRFDSEFDKGIQTIDRICKLTEAQKKKLRLAGRADLRNRLNALNILCKEVPANTPVVAGNDGEMEILVKQVSGELLNVDSFLAKALPSILTEEQANHLEQSRQTISRQSVMLALHDLEKEIDLTDAQRQTLTDLMFELLPPAGLVVDTDLLGPHSWRMVLLYKLNLYGEARVKPLLEPEQWRVLQSKLEKYRNLQGVLQRRTREDQPVRFVVLKAPRQNGFRIHRAIMIDEVDK